MRIERHWQRTGAVALLLLPLAVLFAMASTLRRILYRLGLRRVERMAVPVVVVGNVTAGGTGKTPMVAWLARELSARGRKPGIVTRGHGGTSREIMKVGPAENPSLVGDEAVLLARETGCPVFRGADRVKATRALLEVCPDTDIIISDDGLQHYRLGRDLEIAVLDGARGLGNRLPLPAGPLREPAVRLSRCDFLVVKAPAASALPLHRARGLMTLLPGDLQCLTDPRRTASAADFAGQRVHAVAGIGNPEHFFATLRSLGIVFEPHAFPDHHRWRPEDLQFPGADAVLMTAKDAVKCEAFATPAHWQLPVRASLNPDFAAALLAAMPHDSRSQAPRHSR